MNIIKSCIVLVALFTQFGWSLNTVAAQTTSDKRVSIASFEDKSGQLTANEALDQKYIPSNERPNAGLSKSALWLKIKIPPSQNNEKQYLTVWPPRLDNIELYRVMEPALAPDSSENTTQSAASFERIPIQSERKNFSFFSKFARLNNFELGNSDTPQVFLLKLKSDFALQAKLKIANADASVDGLLNQEFVLGGIILALIPLIFILLALSVHYKSNIYTSYFFTLSSTLILYLLIQGFNLSKILFGINVEIENQMIHLIVVNTLCSLLFISFGIEYLGISGKVLANGRKIMIVLFGLDFIGTFYDAVPALKFLSFTGLIFSFFYVYTLSVYIPQYRKSQLIVASIFISMSLMGIFAILNILGLSGIQSIDTQLFQLTRLVLVPFIFGTILWVLEKENEEKLIAISSEKTLQEKISTAEIQRRVLYENFITMLVHEIKTPLSTIQIASSSLKRHISENSPEQKRIDNISASTNEINQIFNKCLQVIDIENQTIAVDPIEFTLGMLVEDLKKSINSSIVDFEVSYNPKINTDYVILRTIILNLLTNAIKYAKEGSVIKFATHSMTSSTDANGRLLFKVTNQIGTVGSPDPERVFSRYYRSESAKQFAGSGLGLWLSQQLATYINSNINMLIQKDEISFQLELSLI